MPVSFSELNDVFLICTKNPSTPQKGYLKNFHKAWFNKKYQREDPATLSKLITANDDAVVFDG